MTEPTAVSGYLGDILSQPEYLRGLRSDDVIEAAAPVWGRLGEYGRIILTGMGASHAALRPLWLSLVAQGRPAWLLDASELLASCLPLIDAATLVVAASQSGRSAELVALAEEVAERRGTMLAITNNPESPLASRSAATLQIRAGAESTVSTKTYLNTVAVGLILGGAASGPLSNPMLQQAADGIEAYLRDWRRHVAALGDAFGLPERLYFLARGTSLAAAECGALITKEAAKWPVEALGAAQFRHGPLELADPRLSVVILGGDDAAARDLNRRLYQDLTGYGARAYWLDSSGDGGALSLPAMPPGTQPLAEIVPLQLLTIAIAEAAGLEAGVFRHLTKVTTVLTAIGIDIGGTNIRALAMDASGQVIEREHAGTAPERGPQETIAKIIGMVRGLIARIPVAPTGLGIGVTGPVDPFTGIVANPYTLGGWPDTDLRSPLVSAFGLPVAVDNDANVAAVGEAWLRAGRGCRRVAMVTIGTGIGVAILLDGVVQRAADGRHGEAGHMVLRDGGPLCYCGASGCWEILASGPAIARAGRERAWREGGGLWTLAGGKEELVDAALVFAAAAGGDPPAQSVIRDAAYCIGLGLANLAATVMPEVFILTGGVAQQLEAMRPYIEAVLHRQSALIPTDIPVLPAQLGDEAGAIGAARLALVLDKGALAPANPRHSVARAR